MNTQENTYLTIVKKIFVAYKDPVELMKKLLEVNKPDTDGFSPNTLNIIDIIEDLRFEYEDGELELVGGGLTDKEDEEHYKTERLLATKLSSQIKDALKEN